MLAAGLFLHPGHQLRPVAVSVTVGMLVVALVRALLVALALHPAGCGLVQATGTVCLLGLSLVGADWHGHRTRSLAGLAFLLVGLVAGCLMPGMPLATEAQFAGDAPTVEDIIADIDEQRVAVYGMRASAIYHDPHDTRFVARIDFHQGLFLEQGGDEILHLLVPPDDDRFYPARVSPFSSIHAEGRPWLLLEKSWPSGWQLWRCVITPERHSHLDGL
jgi:hypothetical protein